MDRQEQGTYNIISSPTAEIHALLQNGELNDRGNMIHLLDEILPTLKLISDNIENYIKTVPLIDSPIEKKEKKKDYKSLTAQIDEFVDILENDFENLPCSGASSIQAQFQNKMINHLKKIDQKLDAQVTDPEALQRQIQFLINTVEHFRNSLLNSNDRDFLRNLLSHRTILVDILLGLVGVSIFTGSSLYSTSTRERLREIDPEPITLLDPNGENQPSPSFMEVPSAKTLADPPVSDKVVDVLGTSLLTIAVEHLSEGVRSKNKD